MHVKKYEYLFKSKLRLWFEQLGGRGSRTSQHVLSLEEL